MQKDRSLARFFWVLSGDDYRIIEQCSKKTRILFSSIGLLVLVITCLCFFSSYIAFVKLFGSYLIGVPLGLFFAWMIINIYILVLYTLSKNVLPHIVGQNGNRLSRNIRIGFLIFISIVISKPIEVLIFSNSLSKEVATYKSEKMQEYQHLTNAFYDKKISALQDRINQAQRMPYQDIQMGIASLQEEIKQEEKEKQDQLYQMEVKLSNSTFFVKSILILGESYPACWLVTLLCCIIFVSPLFIKSLISETNEFNKKKRDVQVSLILKHYEQFKADYRAILNSVGNETNAEISYPYERQYEDAPFNTIRKKGSYVGSGSDLTKFIYHG
jgi:hypothetical protein